VSTKSNLNTQQIPSANSSSSWRSGSNMVMACSRDLPVTAKKNFTEGLMVICICCKQQLHRCCILTSWLASNSQCVYCYCWKVIDFVDMFSCPTRERTTPIKTRVKSMMQDDLTNANKKIPLPLEGVIQSSSGFTREEATEAIGAG